MSGMVAAASPGATHTLDGRIADGTGLLAEGGIERDAYTGEVVFPARRWRTVRPGPTCARCTSSTSSPATDH